MSAEKNFSMKDTSITSLLQFLGICFLIYLLLDSNQVFDRVLIKVKYENAEQGDADAQFALGQMYQEGKGVKQDLILAHMWFNIAASNGSEAAKKNRDAAESRMTSEQIGKAQELARQCVESDYKDCG